MSSLAFFAALASFPFGLIVGSFANVAIHRLPLGESIVFPPSRCPKCRRAIRPWQNLPVVSWILLRGRCASCREPISARYPAVELLHGLGFALIVWKFGPLPFTLVLLSFFFAMVVLAFIDWDHQILPDLITLPGILIGLAGSLLPGALVDWKEAGLAASFGYLAFMLVADGYARLRGIEGLGQGDWKLAAMMGAFLGGQRLMLTVLLASFSGMTYGLIQAWRQRREELLLPEPAEPILPLPPEAEPETAGAASSTPEAATLTIAPEPVSIGKFKLPFGTFLAACAIFVLFSGDPILIWYASLFRFE
jgi:leader peptidase (prepilin peptidase)/N-methyltransferase